MTDAAELERSRAEVAMEAQADLKQQLTALTGQLRLLQSSQVLLPVSC